MSTATNSINYLLTTQLDKVLIATTPKRTNLEKLAYRFQDANIVSSSSYYEFEMQASEIEEIENDLFDAGFEHQSSSVEGWGWSDETHYIFINRPERGSDVYQITIERL